MRAGLQAGSPDFFPFSPVASEHPRFMFLALREPPHRSLSEWIPVTDWEPLQIGNVPLWESVVGLKQPSRPTAGRSEKTTNQNGKTQPGPYREPRFLDRMLSTLLERKTLSQ